MNFQTKSPQASHWLLSLCSKSKFLREQPDWPAWVSCHSHPISCAWDNWGGSCHGLREVFGGSGEAFSMESEGCEWVGMSVMSAVFKKEVDSVFLIYFRYTNNWTKKGNSKWLVFSLWFTLYSETTVFLSFYIFNDFQLFQQNASQLSKNTFTNLQSVS